MTTTASSYNLTSQLINGLFAIKPLAQFAKHQARNMIIKRAETIGVPWRDTVEKLQSYPWEERFNTIQDTQIQYSDYYLKPFHAYDAGNLCWEAAWEQEVAAYSVHAKLWEGGGKQGETRLRENYTKALQEVISTSPEKILDLACGVGLSTFSLQTLYPQAECTGIDLSPYFLAMAQYNAEERQFNINWKHAAAESTGFPDDSFDFVSASFLFHELPQKITRQIFQEVKRILRSGGYFAILDSNPKASAYRKMPPYVFTLLKITEPYLDEYFTLDVEKTFVEMGFTRPQVTIVSPRHRSVITQLNS